MKHAAHLGLALILLAPAASSASAQEEDATAVRLRMDELSTSGAFTPGMFPASSAAQAATVRVLGGYDSAADSGVFDSLVRARIFGPVTIHGGAGLSSRTQELQPRIGAGVQLLKQDRHGLDGSLALSYKAEGFTEPEGEIEAELAVGRTFGRVSGVLNLAYGQDPEGKERDGEVRLAATARLTSRISAGVAGQLRFDLGEEGDAAAAGMEARGELDLVAGPTVAVVWNRFAFFAQGGVSALQLKNESFRTGALVLGGVGSAF